MRFVEDPSIADAARIEHAVMMDAILRRYETGESYFVARERVMAEHGPRIAKAYGKETANRALRAVTSHRVIDLPRSSRRLHEIAVHDRWLEHTDAWFGPGHYFTARQRFFIRALGVPHWCAAPVLAPIMLMTAVACAVGAWWVGWSSWPGLALLTASAAIVADAAFSTALPAGRDLAGEDLERWRARTIEDMGHTEPDPQEGEIQDIRAAQRTIRDFARLAERDAKGREAAALPPPEPLDDFGAAYLKPKGFR